MTFTALYIESGGSHATALLTLPNGDRFPLEGEPFKAGDAPRWPLFLTRLLEKVSPTSGQKVTINDIDLLCWGVSGLGLPAARAGFQAELEAALPRATILTAPDYFTTFFANDENRSAGSLLILGTGAILVEIAPVDPGAAKNPGVEIWPLGEQSFSVRRFDGWGVDFGDVGGGAWFGGALMRSFFQLIDVGEIASPLVVSVRRHFGGATPREIALRLAGPDRATLLAEMVPVYIENRNSPDLREAYSFALARLTGHIGHLATGSTLNYSGGIFRAFPTLAGDLSAECHRRGLEVRLAPISHPGREGALALASYCLRASKSVTGEVLALSITEIPLGRTASLSTLPVEEYCRIFLEEEARALSGLVAEAPGLARAIEAAAARLAGGGRLFYFGAGTSGRLGILDASEIPPTFGEEDLIHARIAGGERAITCAVEGAEDRSDLADQDFKAAGIGPADFVVGLSAGGGAPYTLRALELSKSVGAATLFMSSNPLARLATADHHVLLPSGREILSGSTRLKAGTCTKVALNCLSTGIMVRLGKTHHNLMVDLKATNAKLVRRAIRLFRMVCGGDESEAGEFIERAGGRLKTAIIMKMKNLSRAESEKRIEAAGGHLHKILDAPPGAKESA